MVLQERWSGSSLLSSCLGSSCELAAPLEALDTAAAPRCALDPDVGGVAVGADVDNDLAPRRTRRESVPTRCAADGRRREPGMDMLQRDSSFVFAVAQNQQTEVRRQHPHIKLNAYRPVLIPSTEHEERAQTAEMHYRKR